MGRVIAIGPGGRPQAPQRSDFCRGIIDEIVTAGALDRLFLTPVTFPAQGEAGDFRRGLLLSCRYYCSCGRKLCTRKYSNWPDAAAGRAGGCPLRGQRVTGRADVVQVPGEKVYRVQFQLHDKHESILAHIQKYGPDPDDWPYYAGRKRLKEDA
jgi:hypothetical protein